LNKSCREAFAAQIRRPGIVNAMHHEGFNKAVKGTGRKKLFVAGVTTEIYVTFPVLQMLEEDYEVQVSADASASWSKYGNDLALRRMESTRSSPSGDRLSPNGQKLEAILDYR
jgi:nicotinamidase-related amidase